MRFHHLGGWAAFVSCLGCGSNPAVPAAATRALGVPASALAVTPICFARPNPATSLGEQADYDRLVSACQYAAAKQNIRVQTPEAGGCLLATMALSSSDTGTRIGGCSRDYGGWSTTC